MQTVEATFKAVIAGNPISGIVLAVPPTATSTSFSGYALVYDPGHATQKLKIIEWNTATLQTLGTVLSSANTTLIANDVIKLTYNNATNALRAYINDVLQSGLNATDATLNSSINQGMGIVVVGNTGADDRMRWDDLQGSCENGGGGGGGGCTTPTFTFSLDFVFGLNKIFGNVMPPGGTPANWVDSAGSVVCGSCIPGFSVVTILTDVIGSIPCCSNANCVNLDKEGINNCLIPLCDPLNPLSIEQYMRMTYIGEVNQGISGVCHLTVDSIITSNMTGYGFIIDRSDNTAKVIQWTNSDIDAFTILYLATYVPTVGDRIELNGNVGAIYDSLDNLIWVSAINPPIQTPNNLKQLGLVALTNFLNPNVDNTITFNTVIGYMLLNGIVC